MTTRREYTAQELEQTTRAEELLRARGLDEGQERIVDIIDSHFQMYRATPVTAEFIVKLIEAQPGLKWLSAAELEYNRTAAENPAAAAAQLANWLANQKTLISTGDEGFLNLTELLRELRGYEITSANISSAIDRIQAPRGKFVSREGRRPLHFVQTPRRTSPISPAAKADDGSPFLGGDMVRNPDGSYRNKNYAEQKSEREAAEAASKRTGASAQSAAVRDAKSKAEQLRGNNHSEDHQIASLFVCVPGTSEINWPDTLAARLRLQKSLNKHRETARFIR